MSRLTAALAAAVTVLLPAEAAVAQEPAHVSAHATFASVSQGGFQDADCLVENTSGEPILAIISPSVTYADGEVQRFHLNQPPTALGPGEAFVLSIGFAVPEDAEPGTATFARDVRVVGAAGGGFAQRATATFEVVPA